MTEALENLFFEETRAIRGVKRQILTTMAGIAKGVSVEGLGLALMKLLESNERHVERLDRIVDELRRALGAKFQENHARPTSWEAEVLRLIAAGYADRQIAAELGIGTNTVAKYRRRMRAKLDLRESARVTRCAMPAGVVEAGS